MYVIGLAGIGLSAGIVFVYRIQVLDREKRTLFILVASLPVLFVRTLYIALGILGGIARFSAISGDVTTLLCMALLHKCGWDPKCRLSTRKQVDRMTTGGVSMERNR
ncbi:hypothetical protein DL95DRAFT_488438 [Leptodontidium sp. 2 PMI_412]|nr:hypothetical protein DL95DRAFT_488438 [Leptodontidium sp. 2 PMI_412]